MSASFNSKCVTSNPAWTPHDLCFFLRQRRRNPVPVSTLRTCFLQTSIFYDGYISRILCRGQSSCVAPTMRWTPSPTRWTSSPTMRWTPSHHMFLLLLLFFPVPTNHLPAPQATIKPGWLKFRTYECCIFSLKISISYWD